MNSPSKAVTSLDWPLVKVRDVADSIQYGYTASASKKKDGPRFLRITDIQDGRVDWSSVPSCNISKEQFLKYRLASGDIVFARTGATTGKSYLIQECPDAVFASYLIRIRVSSLLNPNYLAVFFKSASYWQQIERSKRGIGQPNVNGTILGEIKLPLPPLDIQQQIVSEIERQSTRLDVGVAGLKRAQSNIKRYRSSVLKAAYEGRLVIPEAELAKKKKEIYETGDELRARILKGHHKSWTSLRKYKGPAILDNDQLQTLPEGWTWVTWESVLASDDGAFKRGPFGSALKKSIFVKKGYKVYEQYCPINDDCSFGRYFITPEKFKELKSFEVKAGDYLISCSGVTLGRITRVPNDFEKGVINQALLRVRLNNQIIDHRYFLHLFRAPIFQKAMFDNSTGSAIPNVKGVKELKAIHVPIPCLSEQNRIVEELERQLSIVTEQEAIVEVVLQRAIRLRQSILQQAFAGKLTKQKTESVPIYTKKNMGQSNRHFARALLSAEIVHKLHAEPTFGRVKHQKLFHLCEHIAQLEDIQGQYHREAAGPLDNKLIYANESELKKQNWFKVVPREKYGHAYQPMSKCGEHSKYFGKRWANKLALISRLIELMKKWDTERCEIFSTAYAAWNDLIIWNKEATNEAILNEVLNRWHDSKRRISKERWLNAIEWMRKEKFVPIGFGKPTAQPG